MMCGVTAVSPGLIYTGTELKLDNYFFQEQEISLLIAEAADNEGVGIHPDSGQEAKVPNHLP